MVFAFVLMLLGNFIFAQAKENKTNNSYFGQEKPSSTPVVFAAGIINKDLNCSPSFSPDGKEVFWKTKENKGLFTSKLVDGKWTEPVEVKFCSSLNDYRAAFYSPDGSKLFFLCKSRCEKSPKKVKVNLFYVERDGEGWSKPKSVCDEINCNNINWQISIAKNGNMYYSVKNPELGTEDIYYSKFINGKYQAAEKLSASINTLSMVETTPFIAPDESYLIFSRFDFEKDGYADLYISFKNDDGSWGDATNMGKNINKDYNNLSPQLSADGKYLFYLQTINGMTSSVWVDANVIDDMKVKAEKRIRQITKN
jgi:hypothetical protein